MMKSRSNLIPIVLLLLLLACEKPIGEDDVVSGVPVNTDADANVTLRFTCNEEPFTRSLPLADYFRRLNVMVFDANGNRVLSKVVTQLSTDTGFGTVALSLDAGSYTVVGVGHGSPVSATIKSPSMVQFTARDGRKLYDTFSFCGSLVVDGSPVTLDCKMQRVSAMFRMILTDDSIPDGIVQMRFDYQGGSANYNPTTLQGISKSKQSELCPAVSPQEYSVYTFPYQSDRCLLHLTVSALDAKDDVLRQRVFDSIPMQRGLMTTYVGQFFGDGGGTLITSGFHFTVDTEWRDTIYINY